MKKLPLLLLYIVSGLQILIGQTNKNETAKTFENKADTLLKYFKYDSAAVYYFKAAEQFEREQAWLPCVKNYRLTSNAFVNAAKYDTAYYYSQRAIDLANKYFNESNKKEMLEKSDVFLNIATVLENKGKFKNELDYCRKALTLQSENCDNLKKASIWNNMGWAYLYLAQLDSALYFCEKALQIRISKDENSSDVARSYNCLGGIYRSKHDYVNALSYYQKALKIMIGIYGENHPKVAFCYANIGAIYFFKNEYEKALEYIQKNIGILVKTDGKNSPDLATNYSILGIIYCKMGENNKALEYCLRALNIWLPVYGENHSNIALIYNNMAIIFKRESSYDKALEFQLKGLQISRAIYGENHPDLAISYNNIGTLYMEKGEYDKALEFQKKSLQIRISVYGENHPKLVYPYTAIGSIYYKKREYDKALEFQEKALNISYSQSWKDNSTLAGIYMCFGDIYYIKREYDKALEYLQKALNLKLQIYRENHPLVAYSYNCIGQAYSEKGETMNALKYYQRALRGNIVGFTDTSVYKNPVLGKALSESILLQSLTYKAIALYQLYKNTNLLSDIEASVSTYRLAFQLINKMRNEYNIEDTKLLLSEETKNIYTLGVRTTVDYYTIAPSQQNAKRVFEFIEQGKSATLAAQFNDCHAKHFSGIPDSLLDDEKELKRKISYCKTEIVNSRSNKDGYDTLKVNALEDENFTCSRKLDSLISYFETTYPAYYELKYAEKIATVSEIQKTLDKNAAILDYFVGDSSLFIATITDSLYKVEAVPLDSSFRELVIAYYQNVKAADPELFVSNSQRIYAKLIKPVYNYIAGKNHLIIIPDDYLYYLPFESLIDNTSPPQIVNGDYSKLNYLVKSYSVCYHQSATLWSNSAKRSSNLAIPQKLNFIGFAPVFDKENNNGVILSSNINVIDTTENSLAYRSVSSDLKRFNPLPYSKDELSSIVHLFEKKSKEAKAFIYSEANEENFKNNVSTYDIVHISSHGFSNDREPALSGIVFSQPTDTLGNEDGILYTGETYDLNLKANLIVLSACESGLGKLIKGEGLQALSRGFLYAGAPNVIFSLWRALDKPTKDLMVQFYAHLLEGKTYTEALRQAKLKLINDPKTAFPHFWGGFVLVGR